MKNSSITAIEHIKRKLDLNEMSVLVGAGFSKNIDSHAFLSWWELLKPMVLFLFEDEIELDYNSMASRRYKKSKNDFINERIKFYINKIGYTKLVSLYGERKGNLESITTYIEANTPWINVNPEGEKELVLGRTGNLIKKLTPEMLTQHELLININWNNIYTTNYDNTLEALLDHGGKKELNDKCDQLKKEILNLDSEVASIQKKHIQVKTELDEFLQCSDDSSKIDLSSGKISDDRIKLEEEKEINEKIQETRKEVFNTSIALNSKKNELEKKRQNFILLENALHDVINIVTKSNELGIKRNRNIIKLHGNLRHTQIDRSRYGFDGDNRTQYIFSEDSYKEYPLKHEAFTNLMRISLLQESFLLIGFSGVDPNFTEWIKWVRDIIEVKETKDNKKVEDYKIYFLDLNNAPIDEDLELYYENHNILRIKLADTDVISFLEENTLGSPESEKSYKYIVTLFLKYLTNGINSLSIKLALRQFNNNQITALLNKIISINISGDNLTQLFIDFAKEIEGKENLIKYTVIHPSETISFITFLQKIYESQIKQTPVNLNLEDKRLLLKSICAIIEMLNIPLYKIFHKNDQLILKENIEKTRDEQTINHFLVLWEKQYIFNDKESIMKNNRYKAYNLLYQLKFDELNRFFPKWKTNDNEEDLFTKLSIQYLFNKVNLSDYLSFEDIFINGNVNTYLKYLQLAKIIVNKELYYRGIVEEKQNNKIKQVKLSIEYKINYLIDNGVLDVEKKSQNYIDQLSDKQKIEKYGNNRFSTSKTIHLGETPDQRKFLSSIQYLYSLQEYTNPLHINEVKSVEWYELTKLLLNLCPYPIVFYSLCKGDKDLLRHLSKDLFLLNDEKNVFKSLMQAFNSNNLPNTLSYEFRVSIIILMSDMLHYINTKEWESFFTSFWKQHKDVILEDSFRSDEYTNFVSIGIRYVSSLERIILDIIGKISKTSYKDEYRILPKLTNAIENNDNIRLTSKIEDAINQLFINIDINKKYIWTIASVLFDEMPPNLKSNLKKLVKSVDFEMNISDHYFADIVFKLSSKDKELKEQFEKAIFTSKRLWDTGYSPTEGGYSHSRIGTLFFLSYFKIQLERAIKEESPQINELYNSIGETYSHMKNLSKHNFAFDSFDTQIRNIIFFLNILKENSKSINDISLDEIDQYLIKYQEIANVAISTDDIKVLLSSGDREDFNKALEAINYEIFQIKNNISDFNSFIKLILGKIITSNNNEIESALVYITNWLWSKKNEFIKLFGDELLMILEKYYNIENYSKDLDKIYVVQHLVIIAIILSHNKDFANNNIVQDFINKSKKLNFNIINKAIKDAEDSLKKRTNL